MSLHECGRERRKLMWDDWYDLKFPEDCSTHGLRRRLKRLDLSVLRRLANGVRRGDEVSLVKRATTEATKILEEMERPQGKNAPRRGRLASPSRLSDSEEDNYSSGSEASTRRRAQRSFPLPDSDDDRPRRRSPESVPSTDDSNDPESPTTPPPAIPPRPPAPNNPVPFSGNNDQCLPQVLDQYHLCLHSPPWCFEPKQRNHVPEDHWLLVRAECRFTRLGMFLACENCAVVTKSRCVTRPIIGHERTALLVLFDQADRLVRAVHQYQRSAIADASLSDSMHSLLADLSTQAVIYCRSMRDFQHIETVDGAPAVWAVFMKLVKVVDVLVPAEGVPAQDLDAGYCTNTAADSLSKALGHRGLLPECLRCLGDNALLTHLEGMGASQFVAEFRVQVLLIVRLVLSWQLPSEIVRPDATIVASEGHVVLCNLAVDLQKSSDPCSLGQLSLTFDAIRLLLRSNEGINSFRDAGNDASPEAALPIVSPVGNALTHMAALAKNSELHNSMNCAMVSAVRLFRVALRVPCFEASDEVDEVAKALKKYLGKGRLTRELVLAVCDLAECPKHFALGKLGEELLKSLSNEHIPDALAVAAHNELQRTVPEPSPEDPDAGLTQKQIIADGKKDHEKNAKHEEASMFYFNAVVTVAKAVYADDADRMKDFQDLIQDNLLNFGIQPRISSQRAELRQSLASNKAPPKRRSTGIRY
eukprot:TRINITY_DN11473_c0_g2_i1.p1 TRINITY_DN11473_c0_g2~~TRINITY_DN11473_c0_g2_i1.p1  ORF type:complete len:702 (-),score=93.22 TRINITY_DN11473_c0_g2_i1:229-2334(-)